ncbi:Re/Si-specific NAD(P)(+) transhydrogenase subunit alpha [Salinisphaera orenii]|uniref:proton-translocating NAD(P)(+) transhydrogenase n=1 Tax=Salinisphaera orenii YIM 95161 TaxID=1051139 RepID=A0A423PMZ8_9GAMM|nr:Re/Si-specific NAD(P)(+) transhydrogenase subunit alpha [Salinisphaera halophila]ROO26994.1 NAD(P) transhydrogenase subunit alpha [Salinisphaera halophila YIM 95161]
MSVKIAVPKETADGETRVAMVPKVAAKLAKMNVDIRVAKGAGEGSRIPDDAYDDPVQISDQAADIFGADIVLGVNAPEPKQIGEMKQGSVLISFVQAHNNPETVKALNDAGVTCFAMELVPRITRAQSMDALSSQASAAGYKAALMAANALERFLPMLTTAAGTIRPAKVLVIGAGVAGLQAIATAKRLGAKVFAYDVRTDTKEQVESLGADFLMAEGVKAEAEGGYARELTDEEKKKQQDMLEKNMADADAVITTAAVPGKPAPKIISEAMVDSMKPGSVLIDLGASGGGNCELTKPDEVVTHGSVTIHGPSNVPALLAEHASEMYAQNLFNFLQLIVVPEAGQEDAKPADKTHKLEIDWDDEVLAKSALTHDGQIVNDAAKQALEGSA